jgi:hypothetical protein
VGARVAHDHRCPDQLVERDRIQVGPLVALRDGDHHGVVQERDLAQHPVRPLVRADRGDPELGAPFAHQLAHDQRVRDH